jgi:hypothetical protein
LKHSNPDKIAELPFRLEYAITFGNRSEKGGRKVFQWKNGSLLPGEWISATKNHTFKDVSIRKHYPGRHP